MTLSTTPRPLATGLVGALALAVTAPAWIVGGCLPAGGVVIRPAPPDLTLVETVLDRDRGLFVSDKVLVLDVDGPLVNSAMGQSLFGDGENPAALFVEKLRAIEDDPSIKAVVLRIDSPGGSVDASQIMHDALKNLKAQRAQRGLRLPVVAMLMGTAASGGYYLAMAADEVHALPTTVTGSIGVVMVMPDLSGLMAKLGVDIRTIKSGSAKDAGSPFRPLSDGERAYFQSELVDRFHRQFVEVVAAGRPKLERARVEALADGRVYSAQAAAEAGLIDEVGSLEGAITRAAKLAGLERKLVVIYGRPLGWKGTAYAGGVGVPLPGMGPRGDPALTPPTATVNLIAVDSRSPLAWLTGLGGPRFLYLWQPGW